MDFNISDEQQMIVKTTRDFVTNELYPHEAEIEETGAGLAGATSAARTAGATARQPERTACRAKREIFISKSFTKPGAVSASPDRA